MASIDFALTLVEAIFGVALQAQIKEALCIDRVRGEEDASGGRCRRASAPCSRS